jgi:hypothetical protein
MESAYRILFGCHAITEFNRFFTKKASLAENVKRYRYQ